MRSGFVILLCLAAFGLAIVESCNTAPGINGCSIPGDLPFFYKSVFTPGCNKHDMCYSCGSYHGISRRLCDNRFLRNLREICNNSPKVKVSWWCRAIAATYYKAVRIGGSSSYKTTSPNWCRTQDVADCIAR